MQDAKTRGARVVEINPAGEAFEGAATRKMAPALVLDPTEEMIVMQEEIFGPVLPVRDVQSLDEAIAYVNDRPRPLALYLFTTTATTTERVLTRPSRAA